MNRKGPQKHSKELIQTAITKFESGAKLTAIAKELGIEKSTVKYWLDNATKFLPDDQNKNPIDTRIKIRFARESWDIIFASLKVLKGILGETAARDLTSKMRELNLIRP